jgi:hypothetical protein
MFSAALDWESMSGEWRPDTGSTVRLFAVGQIPALAATAELSTNLVVRTLLRNGVSGVAFGALFIRHNLEAAMVAHMTVHLCFLIVTGRRSDLEEPKPSVGPH